MKNVPVKKETSSTEVAKYDPSLVSGWGGMEGIDPADVLIPKVLIMQPISELVTEAKAQAGSLVRSTTGEALGGKKGQDDVPMSFIPLFMQKIWVVMEKVGQKSEFRRTEPFTAANANSPWNWTENGAQWERNQALNLFALLPSDIEREIKARKKLAETGELPDAEDALVPVLIQFTRSSFKVGKEVATHFAKSSAFGIPAAASTLTLYTELTKGEKGNYYVYKMGARAKTPPAHLELAKRWYGIVAKNALSLKVDEADAGESAPPPDADGMVF